MEYSVGDNVKLNKEKIYADAVLPKGKKGIVDKVHATTTSYTITFNGDTKQRKVPEADLDEDSFLHLNSGGESFIPRQVFWGILSRQDCLQNYRTSPLQRIGVPARLPTSILRRCRTNAASVAGQSSNAIL